MALALFLSAGLVFAAERITKPAPSGSLSVDTQAAGVALNKNGDWKASLNAVQSESGVSLPTAPDQNTVDSLLQAAQSNNITETISRGLLVNLVNAKGQGLGSDIPTQNQIITQALSQIPSVSGTKTYTAADLTLTDNSKEALRAYGNAVMNIFITDSNQEYAKTLVIIDAATTQNDASQLEMLSTIQKKYKTIASSLATVPVPRTLQPFHLQLLNDFANIIKTYDGMGQLVGDPLNGIAAVQQYVSLTQDAGQMFINIAQTFDKNAIIFDKNEPGATWAILLQSQ